MNDYDTKLFIQGNTAPFQRVNMKMFSDMIGVNVSPVIFRKIITTWARSHVSEFIRNSEPVALNHSSKVAHIHYAQNKGLAPQTLVQTYQKEEGVFSKSVCVNIAAEASKIESISKLAEEENVKKRKQFLVEKDEAERKIKQANRSLATNYRIHVSKMELFENILLKDGLCVKDLAQNTTNLNWRKQIVRIVTNPDSSTGPDLRKLWKDFYAGDLKNGIRDQRRVALGKGKKKVMSRNSFIASGLRCAILNRVKYVSRKVDTGK